MSSIRKSDVKKWLEEIQGLYEAQFIDAEEKNNEDAILKSDETLEIIAEMLNLLEQV